MGKFTLLMSMTLLAVSICFAAEFSRDNNIETNRKRGWHHLEGAKVGAAVAALAGKRNVQEESSRSDAEQTRRRRFIIINLNNWWGRKRNIVKKSSRSNVEATRKRSWKHFHPGGFHVPEIPVPLAGKRNMETESSRSNVAATRKRSWRHFHPHRIVVPAIATAPLVGKRNVETENGEYRRVETRATNSQRRLQNRFNLGQAAAEAATKLVGRDGEEVRDESSLTADVEKKFIGNPFGLNPGLPPKFKTRNPEKIRKAGKEGDLCD